MISAFLFFSRFFKKNSPVKKTRAKDESWSLSVFCNHTYQKDTGTDLTKQMIWGFLQLIRSRFSCVTCPKKMRSVGNPNTPVFHWENFFLIPWWRGDITRWQSQDSLVSGCERVVKGTRDFVFTRGLAIRSLTAENHWVCQRRLKSQFDSPIISTRYGRKINAPLHTNKRCDIS